MEVLIRQDGVLWHWTVSFVDGTVVMGTRGSLGLATQAVLEAVSR